ncbi:hypothetical protein AALB19_10710 [Oscillospiraceae bacterium 50-58]
MTSEEMAIKLTEVDSRSKSNTHRIDELSQQIEAVNRLATAVEVMATKQDTMNQNVQDLNEKVEKLEAEPGNRWKDLTKQVVTLIVAALIGFALAKIGL